MTWRIVALVIHVLTAVLGIGQVMAVAVVAADARAGSDRAASALRLLGRLMRVIQPSLVLMLLSGLALVAITPGFGRMWWFELAFVLFLGLGAAAGITARRVKKAQAAEPGAAVATLGRVRTGALVMCLLTIAIVALMTAKPQ